MAGDWYYLIDGEQIGPVPAAELKDLTDSGVLQPSDLVWKEGMADWQPALKVPGLLSTQPPPVPPGMTRRAAIHGAISAIGLSFPVAALVALCYRFPIPFAGKFGGMNAVPGSLVAVLIYGTLMLGFLPLAAAGAACGFGVARLSDGTPFRTFRFRIYGATLVLDVAIAIWLAVVPF